MIKNIDIYELKELIKEENILIIDVRDVEEYKNNRILNAINITVENIKNVMKICPNKNKKILVYCSKGIRSIVAAEQLDRFGYTKIYNLKKGLENL